MPDKIIPIHDQVNKKDLELILEVNKKAIEIETEVADQNEEMIASLDDIKKNQDEIKAFQEKLDEKADKLVTQGEENAKDLFKIQVLFLTGLFSLVIQIIQIFAHK